MNIPAPFPTSPRQKLLVLELWGLGDLAMASPFLAAASKKFAVTVLAKNYAGDLQPRFWPEVKVIGCDLPWTAFCGKYRLWLWPWRNLWQLIRQLRGEKFDLAVSARWDPRDHAVMWLSGVGTRIGFPRAGSGALLTQSLERRAHMHRHGHWRKLAETLGLELAESVASRQQTGGGAEIVVIHTGAAQAVRVWPLERFQNLVTRLRQHLFTVQVVCDGSQRAWWLSHGEGDVFTAKNVTELTGVLDRAVVFIGNDSGPGHVAAICGLPTLTIFGPALPEEIAPVHPRAEWIDGKPCVYKPCRDYCRFPTPNCLHEITEAEAWVRVEKFLQRNTSPQIS